MALVSCLVCMPFKPAVLTTRPAFATALSDCVTALLGPYGFLHAQSDYTSGVALRCSRSDSPAYKQELGGSLEICSLPWFTCSL
ncbi:MAG: hypothetical protein JWN04_1281 [Myxococcaceae bacterium]|nr:hypothetical protein [Myxococcaceae bacterium]